jgi:hypothetical protein
MSDDEACERRETERLLNKTLDAGADRPAFTIEELITHTPGAHLLQTHPLGSAWVAGKLETWAASDSMNRLLTSMHCTEETPAMHLIDDHNLRNLVDRVKLRFT